MIDQKAYDLDRMRREQTLEAVQKANLVREIQENRGSTHRINTRTRRHFRTA